MNLSPVATSAPALTEQPMPFQLPAYGVGYAIGDMEYRAASNQNVVVRPASVDEKGIRVPGTPTLAEVTKMLASDIASYGTAGDKITMAVLQAADGAYWVSRAYGSGNFTSIGSLPLDQPGFDQMPMGAGRLYNASHVVFTTQASPLRALVSAHSLIQIQRTGEPARPTPHA